MNTTTIGILYCGEMGCALARLLAGRQYRIVTTFAGRSARTSSNACQSREVGVEVLDSVVDVIGCSDIVFSLVPPAAAMEVANAYCAAANLAPKQAIYVDANSIGPEQAVAIAAQVTAHDRTFVDASIHGLAANLADGATLYLSGQRAEDVARMFAAAPRIRILGNQPGDASAMKMALGSFSKAFCAFFMETALLASHRSMLADMVGETAHFYPEFMRTVSRLLPTCPKHAGRRSDEMAQLQATMKQAGLAGHMAGATRTVYQALAGEFAEAGAVQTPPASPDHWTVESLIERLHQRHFLSTAPVPQQKSI